MTTLRVIARSTPPAYGLIAFASYLISTGSELKLDYVHSLEAKHLVELHHAGQKTFGALEAMQALAVIFQHTGINGATPTETLEIAALISSLPVYPPAFGPSTVFLDEIDTRLTLRTFLVGHSVTLADFATWGLVKINTVVSTGIKKGQHNHAARWLAYISDLTGVQDGITALLLASKAKPPPPSKADGPKANATFELGLPNAIKGQVVTRFPPEPSGYLHIGHAKAAILNQFFANHYDGKFLIRFDDTNPSKEKAEFEQSIVEDLAMLGVFSEIITHTSDYFQELQRLCIKMIEGGNAYADDTAQEKMRDERMHGIASERRETSVADSLHRFSEMAAGTEEGLRWCIRAKISPDNPNKAMRDPVIYRTNILPHHRTGDKYKVYPTYDFACPIVDCLEGVTHALRTNEYRDRNPQYQWMLDSLNLRKVEVWDFGRVNFVYTLLSKRKLKWFVDENYVRGWDDARFPTVRGIRRRGMTIEALTQYMLIQGPSQAVTNLEWDSIWSLNKKAIDPIAPRHVALDKEGLVKVTLTGAGVPTTAESRTMPLHKKNADVGAKQTIYHNVVYIEQVDAKSFVLDEEVTLMEWGNFFVRRVEGSDVITSMEFEISPSVDYGKTKKITWLAVTEDAPFTPVTLIDYDYLITKKKLEEDDSVENFITPVTEFTTDAVADANVRSLKKGQTIQFERKTYFIVDKAYGAPSELLAGPKGENRVELILIPDGKAGSIVSKYAPELRAVVPDNKPIKKSAAVKREKLAAAAVVDAPRTRIPEPAPTEAVETTLIAHGGIPIPVLTKMFCVPNPLGDDGVDPVATTTMHVVKPVYDL